MKYTWTNDNQPFEVDIEADKDSVTLSLGVVGGSGSIVVPFTHEQVNGLVEAIKQVQGNAFGNGDINAVVGTFKKEFNTTKVSKYDRFAAQRLVRKFGLEPVTQVIELLARHQGETYVPVINNISQLENKWVSALQFAHRIGDQMQRTEGIML